MNKAVITIIADNVSDRGLTAENGLSFLIQAGCESIVFDIGQSEAVFSNAAILGIDMTEPQMLVLSHGHYDHTGGVAELLRINPEMMVYYHPDAMITRFSLHPGKPVKEISMPPACRKALLHHLSELRHPVTEACRIASGIGITGEIPRLTPFEDTGGPFFLDSAGNEPDRIRDDQALWLETPSGLVIVLGCCHSGLVNTVEYIRKTSRIQRVRGIIGGMHLLHASEARLAATSEKLREWAPEFIIPCHCTGDNAIDFMRSRLGGTVRTGYAGMKITI